VVIVGPEKPSGLYMFELKAVSFQIPAVPPVVEKLQYCGNSMNTIGF
jgi:hypothetical protein